MNTIKINDFFLEYIEAKRDAQHTAAGSYNEAFRYGELHEMEKWLDKFGVELEYFSTQAMIKGEAEVKPRLKKGLPDAKMQVFVVRSCDYSGEDYVSVHLTEADAWSFIEGEASNVSKNLAAEGYTPSSEHQDDGARICTKEQDEIWYAWHIYESDMPITE